MTHVTPGESGETTIKTGRDQFAGATYDTFFDILYRDDLEFEWLTLEAQEVATALVDAIGMTEATLVAFTPRDIDGWKRAITGDPGGRLIQEADVPVMVFPDRRA